MIAIISDIHGNYPALKSVLREIDSMRIKDVFCLGDIVGYYPQVNECCEELQNRDIKCILGNHDWYLISNTNCPRSNSANDCLKFQRKVISSTNHNWLQSLPISLRNKELSMVHAGWNNPLDEYLTDVTVEYFNKIGGNFFASGHTHKQRIDIFEYKSYCNPGSVGQPRDGNWKAAFATFDGKNFTSYRVEYDVDETCEQMRLAGFSEYYYKRLKLGSENFI
jgi:predicted phosphodiesterase